MDHVKASVMMITVDDVLKAFGGAAPLSAVLKVSVQAVWNMKVRGSIPVRHWATLMADAKGRLGRTDITPDQAEILSALSFETFDAMRNAQQERAG